MITLLASIAGFVISIIPELLKLLKDRNDKKHELDILDRQIEHNKHNNAKTLEEIYVSQDLLEQAAIYSTYKSGHPLVDAINASVRPVLAYSFFIMYVGIKIVQYKAITVSKPLVEYLDVIWNIDDQAIFAGIISFYFGQRTFSKFWRNR